MESSEEENFQSHTIDGELLELNQLIDLIKSNNVENLSEFLTHFSDSGPSSNSNNEGFFLGSSLSKIEKEKQVDVVSSTLNHDLIRAVDSLIAVLEQICKVPDGAVSLQPNKLIHELIALVEDDYLSCVNELILRLSEFKERLSHLSFGESFELVCIMKRLNECKGRLLGSFIVTEQSMGGTLWGLSEELQSRVGMKEEGKFLVKENKERYTESARFGERVLTSSDSVKFSSSRFGLNRRNSFNLLDSTE
ncbi:hypothetical protein ACET3Z_003223 [Daucus carota]